MSNLVLPPSKQGCLHPPEDVACAEDHLGVLGSQLPSPHTSQPCLSRCRNRQRSCSPGRTLPDSPCFLVKASRSRVLPPCTVPNPRPGIHLGPSLAVNSSGFLFHDMGREASKKQTKELRSIRVEAGRRASQLAAPRRQLPARGYFCALRRPTFEELLAKLSPWKLKVNNAEYDAQKQAIEPRGGDDADADLTRGQPVAAGRRGVQARTACHVPLRLVR